MGRQKKAIAPNPTLFYANGTFEELSENRPQAVVTRQPAQNNQTDQSEGILIYGEENSLPQRISILVSESPAAQACINTVAKYIKGSKFSDENLMNVKIDKSGRTLWQLHTDLCNMIALFDGFAVNFKFDREALITNAYVLPFESVRLSKPDDYGNITEVKYNPYYGTGSFKKEYTKSYSVFDKQAALNQVSEAVAGGKKKEKEYPGQVYYYGKTTPTARYYPIPAYWSAKDWIYVDGNIQQFHRENLKNGFFQSVLLNVIGDPSAQSPDPRHYKTVDGKKISTKTVGEAFNEMMAAAFSGSKKAGTAMAMWSQNHDTAVKVQPFQTNSNSDLFNALQDLTTKNITIATQVPGILANISEGVNLGSGGSEIQKAVELMQSRVAEEQNLLEQFYNEVLLPNLSTPVEGKVEIVNFNPVTTPVEIDDKFWELLSDKEKRNFIASNISTIKLDEAEQKDASPQRTLIEVIGVGGSQALMDILTQYSENKLSQSQAANILQILFGINQVDAIRMLNKEDAQTQSTQTSVENPDQPVEPQPQINENFRNLTGKQLQGIQRIVRKYNKGELTEAQASDMLKQGFGMTDSQIAIWLVTPEEE